MAEATMHRFKLLNWTKKGKNIRVRCTGVEYVGEIPECHVSKEYLVKQCN